MNWLQADHYVINENGVHTAELNENKTGWNPTRCLTPTPMNVVAVGVDDDGTEYVTIRWGVFNDTREWTGTLVEALQGTLAPLVSRGAVVTLKNRAPVQTYLGDQMKFSQSKGELQTLKIRRAGWSRNFKSYTLGMEVFGEPGTPLFELEDSYVRSIKCVGFEAQAKAVSLAIRNVSPIWEMAWAASFVGPLIRVLGLRSYTLSLWGPSGYGKSLLQAHMAATTSHPDEATVLASSSEASMPPLLSARNDGLCWLDDTAQTGRRNPLRERMTYIIANGVSARRATQTGTLRKLYDWKILTCVSGEAPLLDSGAANGAVNRFLELHVDEDVAPEQLQAWHADLRDNYGWVGRKFISKLVERVNSPDAVLEMKTLLRDLLAFLTMDKRDQIRDDPWARHMSVLVLADVLARVYVFGESVDSARAAALAAGSEALINANDERNGLSTPESEQTEEIESWIQSNIHCFGVGDTEFRGVKNYGKIVEGKDGKYAALLPNVFNDFVKEHDLQKNALLRTLAKKGLLARDGEHRTRNVKFGDSQVRCICIKI